MGVGGSCDQSEIWFTLVWKAGELIAFSRALNLTAGPTVRQGRVLEASPGLKFCSLAKGCNSEHMVPPLHLIGHVSRDAVRRRLGESGWTVWGERKVQLLCAKGYASACFHSFTKGQCVSYSLTKSEQPVKFSVHAVSRDQCCFMLLHLGPEAQTNRAMSDVAGNICSGLLSPTSSCSGFTS